MYKTKRNDTAYSKKKKKKKSVFGSFKYELPIMMISMNHSNR